MNLPECEHGRCPLCYAPKSRDGACVTLGCPYSQHASYPAHHHVWGCAGGGAGGGSGKSRGKSPVRQKQDAAIRRAMPGSNAKRVEVEPRKPTAATV